jgi:type IV pilus assembly protein PilW
MVTPTHIGTRSRSRGFGLVEILVGVTIGLLALLIVYQVLGLAEGYRRTTTAGGDAQSAGMISSYLLAADLAGSGDTISNSLTASELDQCTPDLDPDPRVAFRNTWRPIPAVIWEGGDDITPDMVAVMTGTNRRLVTPLDLASDYNPGGSISVQSPLAFHGSANGEQTHLFVIAGGGNCEVATVGNWGGPLDAWRRASPAFDDATGYVTITPNPALANSYPQGSWVVNLGPRDRVRKVLYDVDFTCSGCSSNPQAGALRVQDLVSAGAQPNPLTSNIVLFKAQYGVDTDDDTFVDTWVSARNAPWRANDVLAAPLAQLKTIKAVRFALLVRSSQFERLKDAEGKDAVGAGSAKGKGVDLSADLASDLKVTLFNCNGLVPCTGEIKDVVVPNSRNYRYRVFEQVVPLTNQIWNPK